MVETGVGVQSALKAIGNWEAQDTYLYVNQRDFVLIEFNLNKLKR